MKKMELEDMTPQQLRDLADQKELQAIIDKCPKPLETIDVKGLINLAVQIVEDIAINRKIGDTDFEESFEQLLTSVYGKQILPYIYNISNS